ncbi:MAG: DinB family protein [Planctomycetota bacterium]|nr:DinB family protein [Planctomycetota bacterium]
MIEAYAAGADALVAAIADLSPRELNAPPPPGAPGTWTIQQIVVHVMDSDLIASHRMKRIIAEPKPPLLIGYDETSFARHLGYEHLDARTAAEVYRLNRHITADILRALTPDAFERWGVHNEHGKVTLAEMVRMYTHHVEHHMRFVRQKRQLLGAPMEA